MKHFQTAVIGGGPGGCCCAISLAQKGQKVLLIDPGENDKFRIGESIPPEMKKLFSKLEIYPQFLAQKHEPCFGSCSYWGDDRRGYNDSVMSPYGNGWHLDRKKFDTFLRDQARLAGVECLQTTYKSSTQKGAGFQLTLEGLNEPVSVDFAVDASGPKSVFATDRGALKNHSFPIICLASIFRLKDNGSMNKLTHLEAAEYGWWYCTRLPGNNVLITLNTDAEVIRTFKLNHMEEWMNKLSETENTSKFIPELELIDHKPRAFAAPSYVLNKVCGNNWLAIGDAASAYDPITSQGIIKSVSNAIDAAEVITSRFLERALAGFEQNIQHSYNHYLNMQRYFYQLENRWTDAYFWKKRQRTPQLQPL